MQFVFLLKESFLHAVNSLKSNKLRSFLSLLGISIGIFAMITVFTVIGSLERSIKNSIGSLGDDVIYIQKWPWQFGGDYAWWDYIKRPVPAPEEAKFLREKSKIGESFCFMVFAAKTLKYRNNVASNASINGVDYDYSKIKDFELSQGRFFTEFETEHGRNVAMLGYTIAEEIFQGEYPIGKTVTVDGKKVTVIGIFGKEGEDMFSMSLDKTVMLPVMFMRRIVNIKNQDGGPMIMAEPRSGMDAEELKAEIQALMRAYRHLKPTQDDDFALNQASLIAEGFKGIFIMVDLVGIIIGGFSILVGGFGIANIMFVSVKEQTRIIGIQKALGAKRWYILMQFLSEAVVLSLLGGIIGLSVVYLIVMAMNAGTDMGFEMSKGNVISGIVLSVSIGIISGIAPARKAAKMDPVEAMSSV